MLRYSNKGKEKIHQTDQGQQHKRGYIFKENTYSQQSVSLFFADHA